VPELDRELAAEVAEDGDTDPGVGEEAGAAGADDDAALGIGGGECGECGEELVEGESGAAEAEREVIEAAGAGACDGELGGLFFGGVEEGGLTAVNAAFDFSGDVVGGDEVHAVGEVGADVDAEVGWGVEGVVVAEGDGTGLPAGAGGAAGEGGDGMEELMAGVTDPVRRFASADDDDGGSESGAVWGLGDCGGEVHEGGDAAEHALGVIDEADELAEGGSAAEIEDAFKGGVMIACPADLHEEDALFEVTDDLLVSIGGPPFDGKVVLAACGDEPVGGVRTGQFLDNGRTTLFRWREVNIAAKCGRFDADAELHAEEVEETVEIVTGESVAMVDESDSADERLGVGVVGQEGGDVGVILPEFGERGADVGDETSGVPVMEVADSGGEDDEVARWEVALQDELMGWAGLRFGHCGATVLGGPGVGGWECDSAVSWRIRAGWGCVGNWRRPGRNCRKHRSSDPE
jgi:hypothetical protein